MPYILQINFLDFNLQICHGTTLQTHCQISLHISMNKMHISLKISHHIDHMNHEIAVTIQLHPSYKMSLTISFKSTMLLSTLLRTLLMKSTKCTIMIHQTIHTNSSQNALAVTFISTCITSLLGICDRKDTVIRNLHSNYYGFFWRA